MRVVRAAAAVGGCGLVALWPYSALGTWGYLAAFTIVVVTVWARLLRPEGPRGPWVLVAAALTCWLAGDWLYQLMSLAGVATETGLPDGLWLAGYPLLALGLLLMVRLRVADESRAGLLDACVMSVAVLAAVWQLLVAPQLDGAALSPATVVPALYPLGDVVLLAALLFLVLSPGRRSAAGRLLVLGLALTLAGDLCFTALDSVVAESTLIRFDGGLLLANALIAEALVHPDRATLTEPPRVRVPGLHPARVVFLTVALVAAPALAVLQGTLALTERLTLLTATILTSGLGVARFVAAIRDQQHTYRLLEHRAHHDELTGLPNRRAFAERLAAVLASGRVVTLLYLDLNGFKAINDAHGHAAGDAILVAVAARLSSAVRDGDLVARLGGDEFVVVATTEASGALVLAERLSTALEPPVRWGDVLLCVGASIGGARSDAHGDAESLLVAADRAMFAHKQAGDSDRSHQRPAVPSSPPPATLTAVSAG